MTITWCFLCFLVIEGRYFAKANEVLLTVENATVEEFPFMATVLGELFYCPAVLITHNSILTEAYCVGQASEVTVYLGFQNPFNRTSIQEKNTQIYTSSHIYIHNHFVNRTSDNDHYLGNIALVKLDQPVTIDDNVYPGKLISKEEANLLNGGEIVKVVGWWYLKPTTVQVETVELQSHSECHSLYGPMYLNSQELCVLSGSNKHLNIIGNVLIVNNKIYGFLKRSYPCTSIKATCDRSSVFTSVVPYLFWISQKTGVSIPELTGLNLEHVLKKIEVLEKSVKESYLSETANAARMEKYYTDVSNNVNNLSNDIRSLNNSINDILSLMDRGPDAN